MAYKDGVRIAVSIFEAAAFHYSVKATCRSCGHGNVFHPHGLWWLFQRKGWDDALRDAPRRFRCIRCGKTGATLALVTDEPTIKRLPMPPAHEWKRAVNRFRS
ncbi:MAG: hypothetical protein ABI240_02435 [Sphingomonas sp.]